MKFSVLTRFGVGITDNYWYENQLLLFKSICLPSMANQTDNDFLWFIAIDGRVESSIKNKIQTIVNSFNVNAHIIEIRPNDGVIATIGSTQWIYDICLRKYGIGRYIDDAAKFAITGMIDLDDAWRHDTIEKVKQRFVEYLPTIFLQEKERSFLTCPSGGAVLTFPHGFKYFAAEEFLEPTLQEFMSMSIFVCSRFLSGITCHSSRHRGWQHFHKIANFDKIVIDTENAPMWLYTQHTESISNRSLNKMFFIQEEKVDTTEILLDFGIKIDEVTSAITTLNNIPHLRIDPILNWKNYTKIIADSFLLKYNGQKVKKHIIKNGITLVIKYISNLIYSLK